jgi:uncharacterized membrane protein
MRSLASIALALAACGTDIEPSCAQSYLDYESFGAAFMSNWCTGCHSDAVAMRQAAPIDINFDTIDEVRAQSFTIVRSTTVDRSMPPAGGPSDAERQMLADWIDCGAP